MIFLEVPEFKTFGMDSSMQYLPFSYKGRYGVKWYLNQYGGNILQSNVEGIVTVLNLTGEVKSTSTKQLSKRKLIVLPGDIIKVTTLVKPETQSKKQIKALTCKITNAKKFIPVLPNKFLDPIS
jgi:uncharacterized membrane protein